MNRLAWLALPLVLLGCSREPEVPAQTDKKEDTFVISTKGTATEVQGEVMTPQQMSAKSDIPLYPGASTPEKESNVRKDGEQARYELVMVTEDSAKKVLDYYKAKLERPEDLGGALMGKTLGGAFVSISTSEEGGKTKIVAVSLVYEAKDKQSPPQEGSAP